MPWFHPPLEGDYDLQSTRRTALGFALSAILLSPPATAGEMMPFDANAFEAAQRAGRPILVEVRAPWCPICFVQGVTLSFLRNDKRLADLAVFTVDFDSRKDLLRRFRVQRQGTWIVFRGYDETGRLVGDATAAHLDAVLATAL